MSMLCVPKSVQLEAFVNGVIKLLTDMPQTPANYKRLLNSGYDLSRPGTTTPQTQEEEHKLHNKRACKEEPHTSGYDSSKPGTSVSQN